MHLLGRPRWLNLGNAKAIGLSDARTLAAEAMLAVAKGSDPAAEKKAERGAGTFAELAARYVEHAKKKNKSWAQGARLVERYATPRWGKCSTSAPAIARAPRRQLRRTRSPCFPRAIFGMLTMHVPQSHRHSREVAAATVVNLQAYVGVPARRMWAGTLCFLVSAARE